MLKIRATILVTTLGRSVLQSHAALLLGIE
jgi:hypothetical protein